MNSIVIPQPLWFSALGFVIFVTVPFFGARLGT